MSRIAAVLPALALGACLPAPAAASSVPGGAATLGGAALVLLAVVGVLAVKVFRVATGRTGAHAFKVVVPAQADGKEPQNNSDGTHIFHKHVQVGRLLGLGAIGKVYKGRYRGLDVAIKVLACRTTVERIQDELGKLIRVRHPGLVLFMGITSPKEGQVCLVSEYMTQGSLHEVLHNPKVVLSWRQRFAMVRTVAQAMVYLHGSYGVVHEAVSSMNVMVNDDMDVKISDYGLSTLRRTLRNSQHQAKPLWSAPEVIKSDKHSQAADVYGFGVLLWEIMTRQVPFSHVRVANSALLVKAIIAGERPPIPVGCPPKLEKLLEACWHQSPSKRPKFQQIVETLGDPVIEALDLDKLITVRVAGGGAAKRKGHRRTKSGAESGDQRGGADGGADGGPGFFERAMLGAGVENAQQFLVDPKDLTVESLLGVGSLGEVYLGKFQGKKVAVKKVRRETMSDSHIAEFANEIRIMCSLRHPNTVLFMGACESDGFLSIVMEYCERGSLDAVLRDKSEHIDYTRVIKLLTDIAQGMNYLHLGKTQTLHRDLKSLNILVDTDWTCKVSDFGLTHLATENGVGGAAGNGGTPFWLAPEAMEDGTFTAASDVYSFGIVVWEVITRECPFRDMNPHQAALAVMTEDARPEIPDYVPPRLQALIRRCWARDPAVRPTFAQVLRELALVREEGLPRTHLTVDNATLYRKRHPVYAFKSRDAVTVSKKWGTGTSQRGDYVIVGPADDVYTCAADIFHRTYQAVDDPDRPNAYRKVTTVLALEMKGAFLIETLEGSEHGKKGDFLAQNPVDGEQWPIARDVFLDMYEAVPSDDLAIERDRVAALAGDRAAAAGGRTPVHIS